MGKLQWHELCTDRVKLSNAVLEPDAAVGYYVTVCSRYLYAPDCLAVGL